MEKEEGDNSTVYPALSFPTIPDAVCQGLKVGQDLPLVHCKRERRDIGVVQGDA